MQSKERETPLRDIKELVLSCMYTVKKESIFSTKQLEGRASTATLCEVWICKSVLFNVTMVGKINWCEL